MIGWIVETVVDLNESPTLLPTFDYTHNDLRVSQFLFGERVEILDETKEFFKVQAVEQPKYCKNIGWHSYPGWVRKNALLPLTCDLPPNLTVAKSHVTLFLEDGEIDLSFGSSLYGESHLDGWKVILPNGKEGTCEKAALRPLALSRKDFVLDAKRFLGAPYLFGGRGAYLTKRPLAASVDCSGLVSLLFRAQGINIPRDAHDQALQAKKISSSELQIGDLVFLRPQSNIDRVTHVVVYLGEETFIEAPESGKHVHLLKRGTSFLEEGENVILKNRREASTPLFGSFWPS